MFLCFCTLYCLGRVLRYSKRGNRYFQETRLNIIILYNFTNLKILFIVVRVIYGGGGGVT